MRNYLRKSTWCDDYVSMAEHRSIEENWSLLKSKLLELRDKFIPIKRSSTKPSWKKNSSIPISKPAQQAIVSKRKAYRQWMSAVRRGESDVARVCYTKASNKVKKLLRRDKKQFEKGIAMEAKKNPKAFWSHTRRKLKTKCGIAPLLEKVSDENSLRFDDKTKADILQRQFASVFTRESTEDVPTLSARTSFAIKELEIPDENVKKKLQSLNTNKSCGPDLIHAHPLKELAEQICRPVTTFFNLSLKRGEVPKD